MKNIISIFLLIMFLPFSAQEITDQEAFKKCRKEFNKKHCLADEDGDDILNYLDNCKTEAGAIENNGCPWSDDDNDGVVIIDDSCPDIAGPAENRGCPWPDSDGDGILDKDDKCPAEAGKVENDGCDRSCNGLYDKEKERYYKQLDVLNKVDFAPLLDILFEEEDFKRFFSSKTEIVFLKEILARTGPECGNDPYFDCDHFEKNINSEITRFLWNKYNFLKLKKRIGNRTIIPVKADMQSKSFIPIQDSDEMNFFTSNRITPFYRGEFTIDGRKDIFYYTSYRKPQNEFKIEIQNENILLKNYIGFSVAVVPITLNNENIEFATQLQFFDENNPYFKTVAKQYKYENGKWIFVKNFN